MLDANVIDQLKTVFATLESELTLALAPSTHEKQGELRELLDAVATTSPRIKVIEAGAPSPVVRFDLLKNGAPTGVRFRGVPGGHEFSSLVLALLNADGKGKLPDEGVKERIRALRGPISTHTYVSLSCTNCPDVVQALNLIALIHGDVTHETIDGALAEDEVTARNVQAVPTVFLGDEVLHVGRGALGELLEKLEERAGRHEAKQKPSAVKEFDVVVVGGGPAGSSAAIYSARKGLKTALVAERIGGQVKDTLGIENLISVTHTEGPKLAADLEKHLRAYPVELLEHRKMEGLKGGAKKEVLLKGGEVLRAPAVILALGAKWRELGVPGEKEHIGRGVAFCPHCDGPFYAGKRVAVVGGGNSGVEAAIDLSGICAKVTLVEFMEELKADEVLVQKLRSLKNVQVITHARVTEVVGDGQKVTRLRYQERATEANKELELEGVFVQIGLVPNTTAVRELLETNRAGEIVVDAKGHTSVSGIYAAGDCTTVPFKQIIIAMGEGAKAALTAFEDRLHQSH